MSDELRHPFDALVSERGDRVRVAEAALLFALDEYPTLDVKPYLDRLAGYARRAGQVPCAGFRNRIDILRRILVEEEDLRGDPEDYYDPRNSYLNDVLDRKRGLPIALSAIWIDVGQLLGWTFEGVNFPGHYLVRCPTENGSLLIAPFDAGRIVSQRELKSMLKSAFGRPEPLHDDHVETAGPLSTLTRMLNNLRSVYIARSEWGKAMRIVKRMLAIEPRSAALLAELEDLSRRQVELN